MQLQDYNVKGRSEGRDGDTAMGHFGGDQRRIITTRELQTCSMEVSVTAL
jgi:hypothetical protein